MPQSAVSKPEPPGLKLFRHEGCNSYLFYDVSTGQALMIDPRADLMEDYRAYIAERRLKLGCVVDTRLHWHHLSGSHLVADAFGVPIAMSTQTVSKRCTRRLVHGEKLSVGHWELEVLETPGVSPDAIVFYGAGLIFSGDTVGVGAVARTDLPGGDPAALWYSLQKVLAPLSAATLVLPGFDTQELLFSTLEIEKTRGADWKAQSAAALIQAKTEEKSGRRDGDVRKRLEYNLCAQPPANAESHFGGAMPVNAFSLDARGVATINVEKYAIKLREAATDSFFLDVRERDEYQSGHIPGTSCIPLSELVLHWTELRAYKRIYVSCQSGRRSSLAARTLDYLGLPDVVNVSGGFKAWENAGFNIA